MSRIAIIGTGISGLGCAHFLHRYFDLTIFEQNDYIGGHTNTVTVSEEGQDLPVDTGFMVFNHQTYPLLTRLFRELEVETKPTDMSFSLAHLPTGYEYNGSDLNTLFGQRKNLVSPRFWSFLLKIQRFNQETVAALEDPCFARMTLGEYVRERNYGQDFLNLYILPMGSAVWSTPPDQMLDFPALTLMRFWFNHGFLGMETRHPWWTVCDGSRAYVRKIIVPFQDRIRLNSPVSKIERTTKGVKVSPKNGEPELFDKVILATHAPTTLALLADPTEQEKELIGTFKYQPNKATLHTDDRFMPKTKRCWAAWNYRIKIDAQGVVDPSTHYWMNRLQGVSKKVDYFVSINAAEEIDPAKVIRQIDYEHPLFDIRAMDAQARLPELNRLDKAQSTYFCGAYFRYGFHEDGFASAVNVSREILEREPW